MKNKRNKHINFAEYCKKVWLYLELEMMVSSPKNLVDEEDLSFFLQFRKRYTNGCVLNKGNIA